MNEYKQKMRKREGQYGFYIEKIENSIIFETKDLEF